MVAIALNVDSQLAQGSTNPQFSTVERLRVILLDAGQWCDTISTNLNLKLISLWLF